MQGGNCIRVTDHHHLIALGAPLAVNVNYHLTVMSAHALDVEPPHLNTPRAVVRHQRQDRPVAHALDGQRIGRIHNAHDLVISERLALMVLACASAFRSAYTGGRVVADAASAHGPHEKRAHAGQPCVDRRRTVALV